MVSISFPKEAALRYASRSPELGQLGIILPAGAILGVGSEDPELPACTFPLQTNRPRQPPAASDVACDLGDLAFENVFFAFGGLE